MEWTLNAAENSVNINPASPSLKQMINTTATTKIRDFQIDIKM